MKFLLGILIILAGYGVYWAAEKYGELRRLKELIYIADTKTNFIKKFEIITESWAKNEKGEYEYDPHYTRSMIADLKEAGIKGKSTVNKSFQRDVENYTR